MTNNGNVIKKLKASTEMTEFDAIFLELVDELTKAELKKPETKDAFLWFKEVLLYNVPHGKKNRGVSVVTSFKYLVPDASVEDLKIALILGWCVELENVGLIAINDLFFLECSSYKLIRRYIRAKPYYMSVMELFQETTLQTVTGQCLDLMTAPTDKVDITQYTIERFSVIAKWKTAFYTFYLPVAIAMHIHEKLNADDDNDMLEKSACHTIFDRVRSDVRQAGISDDDSLTKAKTILLQMGHFYQIQNDYLDCFGTPEVIGKVGTDIQENKCGWLIVKALEIASEEQKEKLKANYGKWDDEAVKKVKAVYNDLKLEEVYKQYKKDNYEEITNLINSTNGLVPKEVFLDFASMIYMHGKD